VYFKNTPLKKHIIIIFKTFLILLLYTVYKARDDSVGWGSALQAGRKQIRFPLVSLEFFVDVNFWPHYGPWVYSASNRNEYQEYFLGGKGGHYVGLTTLPP